MRTQGVRWLSVGIVAVLAATVWSIAVPRAEAQTGPEVLHPRLAVRTVVSGLSQPTSMEFLGPDDFFVLEKATGKVLRIVDGAVVSAVLDLAVNSASERGLLGLALHPDFPGNPGVYLYWTESTTGADSTNLADVPLLGNRVDRFAWDGSTLTFDRNLIRLRAFQADPGQPLRGNHDGGVIVFGPDDKLYIQMGDNGRRGQMQNLPCGPTATCPGPTVPDDQFGGPEPDDAHLTGVILRLNDDGSAPTDNPFFVAGAAMGGQVGANVQKVFAYGVRNGFGMAFDPVSGALWDQQNGDDSFSELNRVEPGSNLGWVQIMGPVSRIAQFKGIETSLDRDPLLGNVYFGLQQIRWSPVNIADTPEEALSRLFMLPGAHYSDPEFSWKFEVAPAGIGFVVGRGLGPQFEGDLIVGSARTFLENGQLFRMQLTGNRQKIAVDDPRLEDRVADNNHKFDITESESLLFGRNFGIATDIQTGPNGNLFVVSLSNGAVYEIYRVSPPRRGGAGGSMIGPTVPARDGSTGTGTHGATRVDGGVLPRPDDGGGQVTSDVSFTLYGHMDTGWGFTSGGETIPGPTMTVNEGDAVTMNLFGEDGSPHQFHIDYDGDGQVDAGEPVSSFFTGSTSFTFTANMAGTFTYRCTVHPFTMYGTWVTNAAPEVHDVAVTGVGADPTNVTVGETVNITVFVVNQGNVADTTDVTAYANATAVGTQSVTLQPEENKTLTFPWDTTGFAPGTYTISANASVVPGETDTGDNQMTDGTVTVNAPPPPPPPGPGDLAATLAGRSAWPDHHHFPVSRFGDTQTLFGKVANVGPGPVLAMVRFTIRDDAGTVVAVVDSDSIVVPVGGDGIAIATWTVQLGKYHVTAQCWFDTNDDATFDGFDPDTKRFSFAVVP